MEHSLATTTPATAALQWWGGGISCSMQWGECTMQRVRGTLIRAHGPWYVIATNSKQYWIWNIGEGELEHHGRADDTWQGFSADLQADTSSSHLDYILNYILHHLQFIEEYFFGICRFDRAKLSSILVLDSPPDTYAIFDNIWLYNIVQYSPSLDACTFLILDP